MQSNKLAKNNAESAQKSFNGQLRHGHVFSPASRAYFAWQDNKLDEGQLNQCEAGKFFPQTQGGLSDSFAKDDSPNSTPPADGKIASGNQSRMEFLDEAGSHWKKHDVKSGDQFKVTWAFTANHVTRRFNYFITKADWNPNEVLSRAQFESTPFHMSQYEFQPFWQFTNELKPASPTSHTFTLPNREGYHVLLAIWEVADTGNAFYQVIDLNFVEGETGNQRPATPTDFKVTDVTENSVSLGWKADAAASYKIVRDNTVTFEIPSSTVTYKDETVLPGKTYSYHIIAVDEAGTESLPSASIQVTTPNDGSGHVPPTAPKHLHTMDVTSKDVDLMWGASESSTAIKQYHVYRDGVDVATTTDLDYKDAGLKASTQYQYFVAAETVDGEFSVPSNVLFVTTKEEEPSGKVEWNASSTYAVSDIVSYKQRTYSCIQAHTSNVAWTPEVAFTLWQLVL